ncbi:MAG: IPT/TIG domain-containing protein [Thermomicrobiales bacterium]
MVALLLAAMTLTVASVAVAAEDGPPAGAITPAFGPATGGTHVAINGVGFTGATAVTFGGTPVASFSVSTDTLIGGVTPAHAVGVADVVVTKADGTTVTVGGFFFTPGSTATTPTVTGINPTQGSTTGHTPVVINGSGFQSDARVTFGGAQATEVHVLADAIIIALTPAHSAGPVDVVVTNANGQSGTLTGGFTYVTPAPAPAPTITAIDPATGPAGTLTPASKAIDDHSGLIVAITGTGFQPHAAVTFGGLPVDHEEVLSSTVILTTPPAHAAGPVDVVVTNPDNQHATAAGGFTYVAPTPGAAPTVTKVDPPTGATGDHDERFVTITGTGFQHDASVMFGTTPARHAETIGDTAIVATAPDHAPGVVDVTVTNPDGQHGTLASAYTYLAPLQVTGVTPNTGPSVGGTAVTIVGTGFLAGAHLLFDGLPATVNAVSGDGLSISATTPAHPAGVANIIVINPNEQHGALSHAFTFTGNTNPPTTAPLTITQVEPDAGPAAGGVWVAVHGAGFKDGVTVRFDTTAGTAVHIINSTLLVVTTPGHAAGAVSVTVSDGSGQTSTLPGGYAYIAPPSQRPGDPTGSPHGPPPAAVPPGGRTPVSPPAHTTIVGGGGVPTAPIPLPPQR